jgi:hypothetical protein
MPDVDELSRALRALAERFVADVVALVAAHAGGSPSAPPSRPRSRRRRADELDRLADGVLDVLARRGRVPVRALAAALGTTSRALAHPLAALVASGRVVQHGERKATTYDLPRRGAPREEPLAPRAVRKVRASSRRAR